MRARASTSARRPISTNCSTDKFQLSLGVRHRFDCCLVSFAVTENLQNLNNTPDIGFQIGFAWVPRLIAAVKMGQSIYCAR